MVNLLNCGGSLTHGRGNPLHRTAPHIASCEDTWRAGLLGQWWSIQWPVEEIRAGEEEPLWVTLDAAGKPIGVRMSADQHK